MITIPHSFGPYYLTSKGEKEGTIIRFGSTNRPADVNTLTEIKRLKDHVAYDQLPDYRFDSDDLDITLARRLFDAAGKTLNKGSIKNL